MRHLNKVFIIGKLTRDPDLRSTPKGTPVCDFGVVVKRKYTTQSGEKKEEPCFLEVVVWAKKAEACHKNLTKGMNVFVEGRLHLDKWESKEGEPRSKIKIVAENIEFLKRE
ncbi:MAG: single-stranded DNA-binding protein [Planctomycetota bacterium]|nr:MAG: single-stranded DNA-binding protein [Planctomycetota bacterium]